MRPSTNPSIPLSTLDPLDIRLPEGARAQIVCPACGEFQEVKRGLVFTHRAAEGGPACSGSRRHVIFDMTPAQWALAQRAALQPKPRPRVRLTRHAIDPRTRRATTVHALVYPPVAPPVHRIAALRATA